MNASSVDAVDGNSLIGRVVRPFRLHRLIRSRTVPRSACAHLRMTRDSDPVSSKDCLCAELQPRRPLFQSEASAISLVQLLFRSCV